MTVLMTEGLATLAGSIEGSALAKALKFSRWGYSLANTGHVLGIALLVGGILPLDLRLLGLWGGTDRTAAVRMLLPTAFLGLCLALVTGVMLFSVRAGDYVGTTLFIPKFLLILTGAGLALFLHLRTGLWIERATPRQAAFHGAASIFCWLGALVCGRLVAYFPY